MGLFRSIFIIIGKTRGWINGSTFERIVCYHRGPEFGSQYSHGGSQPSVTPVSGDLTSSGLLRHAHVTQTHMQANIHTHKIKLIKSQKVIQSI